MPAFFGKNKMIDTDMAANLLLPVSAAVSSLLVCAIAGVQTFSYAGMPFFCMAVFLFVFIFMSASVTEHQVLIRIRRQENRNAVYFTNCSVLAGAAAGILQMLLFLPLAGIIARGIFAQPHSYLTMYALTPGFVAGSVTGALQGFLSASGLGRYRRISMCILSGLLLILSVISAAVFSTRGEMAGLLLRNDTYDNVYAAFGMALGISGALVVTAVFLIAVSYLSARHLLEEKDTLYPETDEFPEELVLFYYRKLLPGMGGAFIFFILVLVLYRIGIARGSSEEVSPYAVWSVFSGVCTPLITILMAPVLCFFSKMARALSADYLKNRRRQLQQRMSLMMRLSAYLFVPAAFYIVGAARILIMPYAETLSEAEADAAVSMCRIAGALIIPAAVMLLLLRYYWKCYYENLVLICLGISAAVTFIAALLTQSSTTFIPSGLLLFALFYVIAAFTGGSRSLVRGTDTTWVLDFALIVISALIGAFFLLLMTGLFPENMPALVGILISVVIFVPIYIAASLLLRAADLRNIEKLPGGGIVLAIARLLRLTD